MEMKTLQILKIYRAICTTSLSPSTENADWNSRLIMVMGCQQNNEQQEDF